MVGPVALGLLGQFETDGERLRAVVEGLVEVEGEEGAAYRLGGDARVGDLPAGEVTADPAGYPDDGILGDVDPPPVTGEVERGIPRLPVEQFGRLLLVVESGQGLQLTDDVRREFGRLATPAGPAGVGPVRLFGIRRGWPATFHFVVHQFQTS